MASGTRKHLLIVATTTGYQLKMFGEAALRLGAEVSLATDRCHVLDDPWGDHAIPVRFDAPEQSAAALAQGRSFDAIVAIGDRPAHVAALAAQRLNVPFHRAEAVAAAINNHADCRDHSAMGANNVDSFLHSPTTGDDVFDDNEFFAR